MTMEGNGPSYQVYLSEHAKSHLKQLHLQAAQAGKGAYPASSFAFATAQCRH
jgi:hypothetical protein